MWIQIIATTLRRRSAWTSSERVCGGLLPPFCRHPARYCSWWLFWRFCEHCCHHSWGSWEDQNVRKGLLLPLRRFTLSLSVLYIMSILRILLYFLFCLTIHNNKRRTTSSSLIRGKHRWWGSSCSSEMHRLGSWCVVLLHSPFLCDRQRKKGILSSWRRFIMNWMSFSEPTSGRPESYNSSKRAYRSLYSLLSAR